MVVTTAASSVMAAENKFRKRAADTDTSPWSAFRSSSSGLRWCRACTCRRDPIRTRSVQPMTPYAVVDGTDTSEDRARLSPPAVVGHHLCDVDGG
jgi:hypothetical protein